MNLTREPDEHAATLSHADWRAVRDHLGDALDVLRREEPLDGLDASSWSILVLILLGWTWGDDRPTQRQLAGRSRLAIRTVRRCLLRLEELEIVNIGVDREHRMGARLAPLLKSFAVCRHTSLWTRGLHAFLAIDESPIAEAANGTYVPRAPANGTYGGRSERAVAPTRLGTVIPVIPYVNRVHEPDRPTEPPAKRGHDSASSDGFIRSKKEEDLRSSWKGDPDRDRPTGPMSDAPPSATLVDAATSRRLALQALAELHRRANPGIPLPRAADASDVRLVEACAARSNWDASTLEQTHMDAIAGAFERSNSGAPTPMFIWGQFHFFMKNAGIGRALRLKPKPVERPKPKPRPPDEPAASPAWVSQHILGAGAALDRIPDDPRPRLAPRFRLDVE